MAASVVTWAGESNQKYFLFIYMYICISVNFVLTGNYMDIVYRFSRHWSKSHAVSCLHTSTELNSKHWERKSLIVYPPQQKDEPRRPAVSNSFNLIAESFSGKGKYLKRIRYHGRGMFGIMDKVHCHYFVKLVEGVPPKVEQKTGFDQAKEYVEQLRNRTIIHSL
uniref:39S ribosomal protein L22, mitochondrial n=1 Tax=Sinocyclocheilus rhinocerous TaxID=307959 RepID=A0A673FR43_9TELE